MQVTLSQKERGIVFLVVTAGATWGGSEKALLARAEMYRQLGLHEFEGKLLEKPSDTQRKLELTQGTAEHVIATVTAPEIRLPFNQALAIEPAIRRLRSALDRLPKPKVTE